MNEKKTLEPVLEIIEPELQMLTPEAEIKTFAQRIEWAGRTCYKSEDRVTDDSADKFVRTILKRGHESVIEHCAITVKFIGDRSMSHQLVRHRLASYSQESQRYCNYGKEKDESKRSLKVVLPPSIGTEVHGMRYRMDLSNGGIVVGHPDFDQETFLKEGTPIWVWAMSCLTSYHSYLTLLEGNVRPEDARSVLPNATKTEVATTYNLRQWRHFFRMRCDKHAQWQIRGLAMAALKKFYEFCPSVFEDLYLEYIGKEEAGKND